MHERVADVLLPGGAFPPPDILSRTWFFPTATPGVFVSVRVADKGLRNASFREPLQLQEAEAAGMTPYILYKNMIP
jgi:hypothetical protein